MHPKAQENLEQRFAELARMALPASAPLGGSFYLGDCQLPKSAEEDCRSLVSSILKADDNAARFSEKHIERIAGEILIAFAEDGKDQGATLLSTKLAELEEFRTECVLYLPITGLVMKEDRFTVGPIEITVVDDILLEDYASNANGVIERSAHTAESAVAQTRHGKLRRDPPRRAHSEAAPLESVHGFLTPDRVSADATGTPSPAINRARSTSGRWCAS